MIQADVNQVKSQLSKLIARADAGEEVMIARNEAAAPEIDEGFSSDILRAGMTMLDVKAGRAWKVRELPMVHRDPFDRLIIAQAVVEKIILVTEDDEMSGYGAEVIRL